MVLVGLKTEELDGLKLLQSAFDLSKIFFETIAVSSLAKEINENNSTNQNKLTIVLKGNTSLNAEEFIHKLKYFEKVIYEKYPRRYFSAWLLAMDEQVILSPELVVPHPRLALDNTFLELSNEIFSEYRHPILSKSLYVLTKSIKRKSFEFMSQGRSLFSNSLKEIEK